MSSTCPSAPVDSAPRFTVEVSEFTVLSHVSGGESSHPRAEFALAGHVRTEGLDTELPGLDGSHPLTGR